MTEMNQRACVAATMEFFNRIDPTRTWAPNGLPERSRRRLSVKDIPGDGNLAEARVQRKLAAILATDVAGYSRLMGLDEEGTLRALKAHRQALVDQKVAEHRGRIFKTTGDGLLAEFASVVDAVRCAVEIQNGMAARNADVDVDRRLMFRIGINLGDIIIDGDDVYGDGVNIAARLEGISEPGGICISGGVHDQVRDKLDLPFEDIGEQMVKNIARPVRAFRITTGSGQRAQLPKAQLQPQLSLPDKPSIAVLPFQNMSGDPEQEYFADGMVEDIITALSRFKELFVIARNSSFIYKGRAVDIQQVSRDLGVRYVLEGSVRKAGNRVRITGQLIDAETRAHLWADRFDGDLADVFELQDRITESVVGALQPSLRSAEIERARRKPPANLDAYDYLLRALPSVIVNASGAETSAAIDLLKEAVRLYPNYAHAHALLANCFGQMFRLATGPEREKARAQALSHARQAITLAQDDSSALATAGFILLIASLDVGGARTALDKSVAINPNSATALTYRSILFAMAGKPESAIEDAEKALRLSPLDPAAYLPQMGIVVAHIRQRRYDEACAIARNVIETNPRYPMSYIHLVVAECGRGDRAEAERQLGRIAEVLPGFKREALPKMFEMFPEPYRSESLDLLCTAGLVARDAE